MREKNNIQEEMGTPIQEFYRDKNVFITGATGFMGKVLVEKLLYSCPHINHLYLLIRTKKDKESHQRIQEYLDDKVFYRLDQKARLKVSAIPGDISKPGLGLTEMDRKLLKERINVIFHVAATVKFDEPLTVAIAINVSGTKEIIDLAREMKNLTAYVYVSTAFSNCYLKHIQEKVYDTPIENERLHIDYLSSSYKCYNYIARQLEASTIKNIEEDGSETFLDYEKLKSLTSLLTREEIEAITPKILGKWPNTYVFTKSVAEKLIKKYSNEIPVCIFRPAIVIASYREPIPGWVDSINGVTGILAPSSAGILRVINCDKDSTAHIVPADMTINAIISAAWKTAEQFKSPEGGSLIPFNGETPLVYNYVSSTRSPINWTQVMNLSFKYINDFPTTKAIWHVVFHLQRSWILYKIIAFILHILPAILFDSLSCLFGKQKTNLLSIYKRFDKVLDLMVYFTTRNWTFDDENVRSLWQTLTEEDKKIFPFDTSSLDWDDIFHHYIYGIRHYVFKDDISTIPDAKKRMYRLKVLHFTLKTIFIIVLLIIFIRIIF